MLVVQEVVDVVGTVVEAEVDREVVEIDDEVDDSDVVDTDVVEVVQEVVVPLV